jgi:hypothetical protein
VNLARQETPQTDATDIALAYRAGTVVPNAPSDLYGRGAFDPDSQNDMLHYPRSTAIQVVKRSFSSNARQSVQKSEYGKWLAYLHRLTSPPVNLKEDHARAVRVIWSKLKFVVENLRPPVAQPGGEFGFEFAWNRPEFYLDIDIAADGQFEWFFQDRVTGDERGSDGEALTEPPEELVRILFRLCRAK